MKNFNIKNQTGEIAEIDIFGDIGESWWEEGNTIESVREELKGITANEIHVNIASYGGDVFDAFGIYNILKMHSAKIVTNIIAPTASSGTIIAMAGEVRKMNKPSLFLVHNVWGVAVGNSDEMRQQADTMDVWNNQIIDIYNKRTGKDSDELKELMNREDWLTAEQAFEWGFITEVVESDSVLANNLNDINDDKKNEILQKFKSKKISKMNKEYTQVSNVLGIDGFENTEDGVYLSLEQLEQINAKLTEQNEKINTLEVDRAEEIANKVEEATKPLNEKITSLESTIEENETELESVKNELTTAKEAKSKADTEIANLKSDLNKAKAKPSNFFTHQPTLNVNKGEAKIEGGKELLENR